MLRWVALQYRQRRRHGVSALALAKRIVAAARNIENKISSAAATKMAASMARRQQRLKSGSWRIIGGGSSGMAALAWRQCGEEKS